ncbi:hypothetical protein GLAREA_01935 [Glarea lozoyensis ATCC 20868]|uniref:Uncharacterized protein n=1 Tax=Glarea lozoyensis (strain ATCC 20868 / MF5171) TaxID=1116229 RepID=S3DHG1_GLAL2|nr:uncharacterized protein GLAREA_01935 [Glarea lozoyensis ATCC 20868]EPE26023.1 hypothetical protein GLAREA_01935 [Glarea lozoyensis ATCC 20868]
MAFPMLSIDLKDILDTSIYIVRTIRKINNLSQEQKHHSTLLQTLSAMVEQLTSNIQDYVLDDTHLSLWSTAVNTCEMRIKEIEIALEKKGRRWDVIWVMWYFSRSEMI